MTKFKSKRQFHRVKPSDQESIRVDINGEDFMDILFAKDISVGGVAVNVPHGFQGCDIRGLVQLIISLPDVNTRLIKTKGHILHLSNDAFGIQFIDLTNQQKKMIKKYVYTQIKISSEWQAFLYKIGIRQ